MAENETASGCEVPIKHYQYIKNHCQITFHKSRCNGKQSTLQSCEYTSLFSYREAELKAMHVGKRSSISLSTFTG